MALDNISTLNGVDLSGLTERQKADLRVHAGHHSKAHIRAMVNAMKRGSNFNQSHEQAMQNVGL